MHGRQYDQDDLICAISYQPIRHPVRVFPSNKVYELDSLLKIRQKNLDWKCPLTKIKIEAIGYDTELKAHLDTLYQNDDNRYANYSSTSALIKLHFYAKYQSIHVATNLLAANLPSLIIGGVSFCLLKLINPTLGYMSNENIEYFLYATTLATIDLTLKHKTTRQIGIFDLIPTLIKSINCCHTVTDSDDEEEELAIFNLRI